MGQKCLILGRPGQDGQKTDVGALSISGGPRDHEGASRFRVKVRKIALRSFSAYLYILRSVGVIYAGNHQEGEQHQNDQRQRHTHRAGA